MLERYNTNYPDKATMGELVFGILNIEVLADDAGLLREIYLN